YQRLVKAFCRVNVVAGQVQESNRGFGAALRCPSSLQLSIGDGLRRRTTTSRASAESPLTAVVYGRGFSLAHYSICLHADGASSMAERVRGTSCLTSASSSPVTAGFTHCEHPDRSIVNAKIGIVNTQRRGPAVPVGEFSLGAKRRWCQCQSSV